jgi:hypothetical protein
LEKRQEQFAYVYVGFALIGKQYEVSECEGVYFEAISEQPRTF